MRQARIDLRSHRQRKRAAIWDTIAELAFGAAMGAIIAAMVVFNI